MKPLLQGLLIQILQPKSKDSTIIYILCHQNKGDGFVLIKVILII